MLSDQPPLGGALSTTLPTSPARGRWNWQRSAQGVWIAFAVVLLVIFVVNIPAFFQYAGSVCTLPDAGYCPTEQLTPAYVQVLGQLHLSVTVAQVFLAMPDSDVASSGYQLFNGPFWLLLWTIVFLGVSIPILRYRLWDIDVLINCTLVYGLLTATLLGTYLLFVFGGQYLLASLFGPNNAVVLVISTLLVAALFQPLRQRVQRLVDRRFYRRKYDAAQVVERFSATLRNEVDLEQLCEQVLALVQETMQPAHISLWIRKPERTNTPSIQISTPPPETAGVDEKITEHGA